VAPCAQILSTLRPSLNTSNLLRFGLLWLLAHVGGERVVWLAVIDGLVAALKGYMLVLMFGKRAVPRPTNS
jgi:hypothetical protein